MNLNKFKKTIGKTNPEKGLRNLVGAQKVESREPRPSTVRVSGRYIPSQTSFSGQTLGLTGFVLSILFSLKILVQGVSDPEGIPFLIWLSSGLVVIHSLAYLAKRLNGSKPELAILGVKIYWIGAIVSCCLAIAILLAS